MIRVALISVFVFLGAAENALRAQGVAARAVPFRGHPLALFFLCNHLVQKDLGISEQVRERVGKLANGYMKDTVPHFRRYQELTESLAPGARTAPPPELVEVTKTLNDVSTRYDEFAAQLINTAQRTRLEQIMLRARGVQIFSDPAMRRRLNITDAQFENMRATVDGYEQNCMEAAKKARRENRRPDAAMELIRGLRRQEREATMALLTPEQKVRLDAILGRKPDFDATELVLRLVSKKPP